ncbi:VOC family protein [Litorihabitans aurantiacus]|uniref:VOC family protein n=1 Tax=Litorihabitans aurantiacus TaxID=1930061 RepID=A0AA37UHF8_9MICO|nr:VOC family protein [Litorihabitans aurantiacus]GMA30783.1 VOC family protein [Litorihabitans aurantiacus]
MTINVNPYLQFRDTARAAMEFYADVFGGEATVSTFGDFGLAQDPADADKVMHSQLVIDGRAWLMASDTPASMSLPEASSVAVSLFGGSEDAEVLRAQWAKLIDGGHIVEDLVAAPWGDHFGMVTDRFGTFWMVNIGADPQ